MAVDSAVASFDAPVSVLASEYGTVADGASQPTYASNASNSTANGNLHVPASGGNCGDVDSAVASLSVGDQ